MKSITREIISGTAAAALVGTAASGAVPLASCILAGGLVYTGLRLLLPAKDPADRVSEEVAALRECQQRLSEFNAQAERIDSGGFQAQSQDMVSTLRQLVQRAIDHPDRVTLDRIFPTRIGQLTELLGKYNEIAGSSNRTPAVESALRHTEKVFERACIGFRDPAKRNSGNMFAALLANRLNQNEAVNDATLPSVMPSLAEIFRRQGHYGEFLRSVVRHVRRTRRRSVSDHRGIRKPADRV